MVIKLPVRLLYTLKTSNWRGFDVGGVRVFMFENKLGDHYAATLLT